MPLRYYITYEVITDYHLEVKDVENIAISDIPDDGRTTIRVQRLEKGTNIPNKSLKAIRLPKS